MTSKNGPIFNSKVLLFGEYSLMKGSMALSIPFSNYNGQLLFDDATKNSKSNHYSVSYLINYLKFLKEAGFDNQLDLKEFSYDIDNGLIFKTNIPISYGLGSSGAIVASIYQAYAKNHLKQLEDLKDVFAKMESYYHGKSSGLDPLVSYLNKPILITSNKKIETVVLPKTKPTANKGIFLIDTKTTGETEPLVNWFLNEYKQQAYHDRIQNQLNPLVSSCISSFLWGNFESLLDQMKLISLFTLDNFAAMIPDSVNTIWKNGIKTENFFLKLCGSGGGGMMLGIGNDLEKIKEELSDFEIHELLRY